MDSIKYRIQKKHIQCFLQIFNLSFEKIKLSCYSSISCVFSCNVNGVHYTQYIWGANLVYPNGKDEKLVMNYFKNFLCALQLQILISCCQSAYELKIEQEIPSYVGMSMSMDHIESEYPSTDILSYDKDKQHIKTTKKIRDSRAISRVNIVLEKSLRKARNDNYSE